MPPINPKKKTMNEQSLKTQPVSSKPKTHIHFHSDEEDDMVMSNLLESEDLETKGSEEATNSDRTSNQDSNESEEDDEGPEVISTAVSKRDVIAKENVRKEFQKSIQIAKKKANKARDEKLKQLKSQSKSKSKPNPIEPEPSSSSSSASSSDEDSEPEPTSSSSTRTTRTLQSNKKYLDPSLFVTASNILEESKRSAEEREQNNLTSIMKKRKRRNISDQEDRREIGNNTTVVRLTKSTHLTPTARPARVSKFVKNRLSYIKNRGSPHQVPKLTLTAKSQMGTRHRSRFDLGTRTSNRPAILFVREPK
ncbi:uncharacterized protein MELLADRAFT_73964 [Melampsora larici-populina 98AG31]|uniref:Uncharacterized protein n=1 Tax=Melampsora larici-populina (strain 98AG31 / pathotype 3-4-7) TaxID=747676 RepID=F4R5A1_MELLP|nr:uncharacterized protein MELLADRAFT_73964 [Melampsora larici-populina 98AG31]EGG12011.1 hypothetical protein MELLADRAFT_73964 [Melampsora larici-populina 98AG31]